MVRRDVVARAAAGVLCCFHGGVAQDASCAGDWLLFGCEAPPHAPEPCSLNAQRSWVVGTSAEAQSLAAAVNCSGGSFEVEWIGKVGVEEPILVANGTVLTVTGDGASAVIDGNSATRLFTVIDAALHVTGVNISSGASLVGGGIAAARSTLTLNNTNFIGNVAIAGSGGGVYASGGSDVSCAGGGIFEDNRASDDGGALFANGGSTLSWTGGFQFVNNSCDHWGGALAVESSSLAATGNTAFVANNAAGESGYGGAISASLGSSVVWSGSMTEFQGNVANHSGGAVAVHPSSELSWSGSCRFTDNTATVNAGALILGSSMASWSGNSEFVGNHASRGGAISANYGSALSWTGSSVFAHNTAGSHGGAILLWEESSATWAGEASFVNNSAVSFGGAIYAYDSSTVVSTGNTSFVSNSALDAGSGFGGAVNVHFGSRMSWSGEMTRVEDNYSGNGGGGISSSVGCELFWSGPSHFSGNVAGGTGGALTVNGASVHWTAETTLVGNVAKSGGAIFLYNGANVSWTGETEFLSNEARVDGGAIGAPSSYVSYSSLDSTLDIHGTTAFANNTSGGNGGAVSSLGGCAIAIGAAGLQFRGNSAGVAGGAVFLSSTNVGPTFLNATFVSNSAQVGGAVSTLASGNNESDTIDVALNPTTFERCRFIDNEATATGGAIDSAAGKDVYISSDFTGNKAGTGGALRLAGTAWMENCSFVENVSDDGQGAAVSNIGLISSMTDVFFGGNAFDCEPGMFLDFNPRSPFEAVCDGCQTTTCENCTFEEPFLEPTCTDVSEHFNSSGGNTTIESLLVDPGYWRASAVSPNVFDCYNPDACRGGETGAADFCFEGYEGPYCAVCSDGYTERLGSVCSKCLSHASGIVLAAFFLVGIILAAILVALYVMSGKRTGTRQRLVDRWARLIPLQSLKVIIVSWQILTQFTSVANIAFPNVYEDFLDVLDVFNFDIIWILSAGCFIDADFHDRLLISTTAPVVALFFLAGTYCVASRINRGDAGALQIIWNKHVSTVLLLTFLVYSSVSATLFSAFACDELDDGKNYLRADYRIECDSSKHRAIQVYAGFMIAVYAVGIPAFYGLLLFWNRDELKSDQPQREYSARATAIFDLWSPYKPSVFYYEVIECGRRILLAGVAVFIYPNTAAQIAVTLMMAFFFVVASEVLAPYESNWDTWVSRMGHAVIFTSMYVALLLKVDVSDERTGSQKVFEAFLVTVHACMILVVVIETVVLAWSLRVEQREDPGPRLRLGKALSSKAISRRRRIAASAEEDAGVEDFFGEDRGESEKTASHSSTQRPAEV